MLCKVKLKKTKQIQHCFIVIVDALKKEQTFFLPPLNFQTVFEMNMSRKKLVLHTAVCTELSLSPLAGRRLNWLKLEALQRGLGNPSAWRGEAWVPWGGRVL